MFELIPLGNANVINVTGDQKSFKCVMDLCSDKFLCLTTYLHQQVVQDNGSDSVG